MKVVIQRVLSASVTIDNNIYSSIGNGLMILVGIESEDTIEDITWLGKKILNLRIFDDGVGVMNKSLIDINGEVMVVSQFTLQASTKKGNRPSYIKAAAPDIAIPIYENFVKELQNKVNKPVKTGKFGANMQINLVNDGPVTIQIDSKNRQ